MCKINCVFLANFFPQSWQWNNFIYGFFPLTWTLTLKSLFTLSSSSALTRSTETGSFSSSWPGSSFLDFAMASVTGELYLLSALLQAFPFTFWVKFCWYFLPFFTIILLGELHCLFLGVFFTTSLLDDVSISRFAHESLLLSVKASLYNLATNKHNVKKVHEVKSCGGRLYLNPIVQLQCWQASNGQGGQVLTLRLLMSYIYIYIYIYMEHPLLMFLDHTRRRTTVGRTPLDEWGARRRDLYLTTHDTHNRQISMPPVGFEPTISAGERPAWLW